MDTSVRAYEEPLDSSFELQVNGRGESPEGGLPCATAFSAETERLDAEDDSCDEGLG